MTTLENNLRLAGSFTTGHKAMVLELLEGSKKYLEYSPDLVKHISDLDVLSFSFNDTPPTAEEWYYVPSIYQ
jgi:hypothetical protein